MTGHEITVSLSLIFSIIAALGVIYTIFSGVKHDEEAEDKKELEMQKNFTKLELKLDEFGRQLREIYKRSEKSGDKIDLINQEIIKHGERIENHEERLKELERCRGERYGKNN